MSIQNGEHVGNNTTATTATLITIAAAGASTVTSADLTNEGCRGVQVIFDATITTTTSAVLKIQGKDPVSGAYYDLLTGAAVTSISTNVYTVYPGVTVASNVAVSAPLPRTWRVSITITGGSSALTATVGANGCV